MLCQNCGKNEATTHIKRVVNGETAETHLCVSCAEHLGYGDMFSGFGFNLDGLFGGLLGEGLALPGAEREEKCPKCGYTFSDIVKNGRLGCADCYRTFYDKLLPSIQRIHGKIKHSGKVTNSAPVESKEETTEEKIEKLKIAMNEAVAKQEFETAAKIRDEIKALEGGESK